MNVQQQKTATKLVAVPENLTEGEPEKGLQIERADAGATFCSKQEEHVISYAYPSSPEAQRHRHGRTGCFILKAPGVDKPVETFELAKSEAAKLGTVPGRWSFDHPENAGSALHDPAYRQQITDLKYVSAVLNNPTNSRD